MNKWLHFESGASACRHSLAVQHCSCKREINVEENPPFFFHKETPNPTSENELAHYQSIKHFTCPRGAIYLLFPWTIIASDVIVIRFCKNERMWEPLCPMSLFYSSVNTWTNWMQTSSHRRDSWVTARSRSQIVKPSFWLATVGCSVFVSFFQFL